MMTLIKDLDAHVAKDLLPQVDADPNSHGKTECRAGQPLSSQTVVLYAKGGATLEIRR